MQPVLERGSIDKHLTFDVGLIQLNSVSYQSVNLVHSQITPRVCTLVLSIRTLIISCCRFGCFSRSTPSPRGRFLGPFLSTTGLVLAPAELLLGTGATPLNALYSSNIAENAASFMRTEAGAEAVSRISHTTEDSHSLHWGKTATLRDLAAQCTCSFQLSPRTFQLSPRTYVPRQKILSLAHY